MTTQSENFAPYASFGNIQMILKRIRSGWTPGQIDSGDLERVGITKSNLSRVMATLEFFGLIFDDGRTNEITWKAIATAAANEYPKVLEGILKSSYPQIFELYPNISDATDIQLADAFRKNQPLPQKDRMVSLFRGLCQEAKLLEGEPLTREQKSSPNSKVTPKSTTEKKESEKTEEPETAKTSLASPPGINPTLMWYNDLGMATLMSRLPKSNDPNERPRWTKVEKERWLTALQGMLDLLIDVEETKP